MGLTDEFIFKPRGRELTPEEEAEEKKDIDLFFHTLKKNGIASVTNPSKEFKHEDLYNDIKNGTAIITDYYDDTGKTGLSDFINSVMNGDTYEK